ncbi:MAG: NAD/NADP octopine/nopaline dehydrogenase family protein [Oscillospiraceae bacterium]|nr:NAD/NADP octopine/nopaline dehydrogenase family protein [Oscillospiraceae bacterium]
MSIQKTWAIIGGGNGGQSMAGHLGILGQKVRLFDVVPATVDALNAKGSITVTNAMDGEGKLEFATTDMGKAMEGADNVILVLPSLFHESIARRMVPHLKDGMTVLLHPEASCGALSFRKVMKEMGCTANVVVGAACTLLYATRIIENGTVEIYGVKDAVPIAALPASDNARLEAAICGVMPWFKIVNNVLETSLDNLNAMMHPAPMLLNTSRIEADPFVPFQYYLDGITPSIGKFVETMDMERIAIAEKLGIKQRSICQQYLDMYPGCGKEGDPLYMLAKNNPGYKGIMGHNHLNTRYVMEDIPYSLVALQAIAQVVGVATPCMDAIINIGRSIYNGANGFQQMDEGRTVEALGLEGMDTDALLKYVMG